MTRDFGINESAKKYFDVISESDTPLQVSLSDKNNAKLTSLCKKLDQLYSLRSKLKEDFFNYLESDQYYYDIYQTIKCLGLATPSLKSNSVEPTGDYTINSPGSYQKLFREYDKKLSSFSKVNLEPIKNNNIQLKKMRRFVENHLIHILVSDAYQAIWTLKDMLHFYGEDGISKFYRTSTVDEEGPSDNYIEESNKMKIYLKKKSNEKLDVDIRRIKKMFTEMHEDNILLFNNGSRAKIYKNKQNLSYLSKKIYHSIGNKDELREIVETINFKNDFSKFFDKVTNPNTNPNTFIGNLLTNIYFKKSLSIEAKYKEEIEKIEQGISTDCVYLKKKMSINYSINLCEKLIKDGFDLLNNTYSFINYKYPDRGYLNIFQNEMNANNYMGGEKFVPQFYVERTKFYLEKNLQHPLDINGDFLIKELDLLTHNNITLGHSSYLFNKLFVNSNTIHDAVTNDKFGDPNPVSEDCARSMNARFALSKNLLDKFQSFIKTSSALKIKQKNIDWIQLELINYFEDNQDDFIKDMDKYKSLMLQSNEVLLSRIKDILHDYESHEKEIQKLRKKVYLNYKKITKNHTKFRNAELEEITEFEDRITEENPKHKRFAFLQIVLYEDPYNYYYGINNEGISEKRIANMKKQNDKEPFSNHNISALRDVLKKDQLSEEDYKYLRSWHVSYSEMKRFHNRPKFLSSNRKKIFNVDDFFKFEDHFLEPGNKDLKDLLSQLFNYINIDQNIATVFQEQIEKRTKNDVFNRDHNLFSEFPQIKIKNNNDYESGIWWLLYNFIGTQKSHIYHSFNNSLKDIILRALLFIRGIYPYRSGSGMKDPYERIITELTKAISFYDSFSEQIYRDKISIIAPLLTNEIINSLRCIRDYIYTLKIANVYEIENGEINNIVNQDIKKNDLQFISRSPQWRNEIPIDFDLTIKKYLKECNKRKKGENENFINKQVYDKKGKQELKTAKNNKSLIDRNSALKWLKKRSGKYKLNELKVGFSLEEDIGFNNYGLYLMTGDTHIKFSD